VTVKNGAAMKVKCTPPHDIPGEAVAGYLPSGKGSEEIRSLMEKAQAILEGHEVNNVRRDLGENPATSVWLWGQGGMPKLPSFKEKYGLRGAAITAVDLIRGIALSVGWRLIEVQGATGYIDTNYRGKGQAAVAALDDVDMIIVHVEAPDESGHNGDAAAKVKALEQIDEHVVGPLLDKLRGLDGWRIMCVPDHPTPVAKKTHTATPPPFCMAGTGILTERSEKFTEAEADASGQIVDPGYELMEYFLRSGRLG